VLRRVSAIDSYIRLVVRSAVNGPDSSRSLRCQHTKAPCRKKQATTPGHFKLSLD